MPATFLMRSEVDWSDSLVMIAFPTVGNAANIACHYLRKDLDLPLVGSIHMEGLQGVVAVEDGISTAPLRIFGGQVECSLGDEPCPTIHLIVSDLPIRPEAMAQVTEAIIEETRGCRILLCLDAIVRSKGDDTPDVYCTAPDTAVMEALKAPMVSPLKGGILVGMSGQVLLEAERADLAAGALLVEATRDLPDGRAAAALVKAIDHLIPTVRVDPDPLQEEAEQLEQFVQQAQQDAERHQQRSPFGSYI